MTSEELTQELNKRNITLKTIEEYIKFEDECVEKGFTFRSLLEAREKQIAKKPVVDYVRNSYKKYKCPMCKEEVQINYDMSYCLECGQKLDWEVE